MRRREFIAVLGGAAAAVRGASKLARLLTEIGRCTAVHYALTSVGARVDKPGG